MENKQKLKQALREAAAMEFAQIDEGTALPEFSDSFRCRMDRLLADERKRRKRGIPRLLRLAACLVAAVLLTGVTANAVCGDGSGLSFLRLFVQEGDINSHGFCVSEGSVAEIRTGQNGEPYAVYSGGEVCLPYQINTTELDGQEIGVLLFVDGQIQPYQTAGNDALQYMHTFTVQQQGVSEEIRFTPVTGSAGEKLLVYFMAVVNPEAYLRGEGTDWDWSSSRLLYLQYEADPPEPRYPETRDRAMDLRITAGEERGLTGGWTEEALAERTGFRFYVNDRYFDSIGSVDTSKPLRLRFMLWGTELNSYGIVFFVNHQPVSVAPEDVILVRNEAGGKTVIEVEVDLSGLTGDVLVYAMLTARERKIDTYDQVGFAIPTRAFFFGCES